MIFYSSEQKSPQAALEKAVFQAMPEDGGLYMPLSLPFIKEDLKGQSFQFVAKVLAKALFAEDLSEALIEEIVEEAFNFEALLRQLDEQIYVLELFHGPSLSFKDFGARFMAQLMAKMKKKGEKIHILVATSGDTGSAVGQGFLGLEDFFVHILYPSQKISNLQEQQIINIGQNVSAIEVKGSFDDCQALVKQAFNDKELRKELSLSSANSISVARLLPQTFYHAYLCTQLDKSPLLSVPCGNFGNLTAALFAKKMGFDIAHFVAAVNSNRVFVDYLQSGVFHAKPSIKTISNAMDVGNPSNFARMLDFYEKSVLAMRKEITAYSFDEQKTRQGIQELFTRYGIVVDPHGAIAYLGLQAYLLESAKKGRAFQGPAVFLQTADAAKFVDDVQGLVAQKIEIPKALQPNKEQKSLLMEADYSCLKDYLIRF